MEELVWYFAYGANMARRVFVESRGMRPLSVEPARLDGYRLTFDEPGVPLVEPGFASIEPEASGAVHGALYRIAHDDLTRLHRTESAGYTTLELDVEGARSGLVRAVAYQSKFRVLGLRPSRRYLGLMQRGARELGLPETYCHFLERQPCVHVPVLSNLMTRSVRSYMWLRERGIRPEAIAVRLRELRRRYGL